MYNHEHDFNPSIEGLIQEIYEDKENAEDCASDHITIYECDEEFIYQFQVDDLIDIIGEERWDDEYSQVEKVAEAIKASVDFEKLNSMMPKLWFSNPRKPIVLTKEEILKTFD